MRTNLKNSKTSNASWQGEQFKVIMNLLFKDNLSRNMLTMRTKGGAPLNFKSELKIKKWKMTSSVEVKLKLSSLSSNHEL